MKSGVKLRRPSPEFDGVMLAHVFKLLALAKE
jgi:hypothetical protein